MLRDKSTKQDARNQSKQENQEATGNAPGQSLPGFAPLLPSWTPSVAHPES